MKNNPVSAADEKVLVISATPYATHFNCPESGIRDAGKGVLYVLNPYDLSNGPFAHYATPRPVFFPEPCGSLVCHAPRYLKVYKIDGNTGTCLREFEVYDLEKDPLMEKSLRTEPEDFFPEITSRVRFTDREVEFREGEHCSVLQIKDCESKEVIKSVHTPYWGFSALCRYGDYLFMMYNDLYDWCSTLQVINLPEGSSFDALEFDKADGRLKGCDIRTLSHYLNGGVVVDSPRLENIVRNYGPDELCERIEGGRKKCPSQ